MTTDLIPSCLKGQFWLVSADMGYGHQRAIYPLKALSRDGIILNVNAMPDSGPKERRLWKEMLSAYEFMSRATRLPIIGRLITLILNSLLYIPKYYPFKDRSKPTLQVRYLKFCIKRGLCNSINRHIKAPDLPMITSFYSSAVAADMKGHKNVYCIICDTDINRVWVPEDGTTSSIIYFASGIESAKRLISYGVNEKNIQLTGFPLPLELLGNRNLDSLKTNLSRRLRNLDPEGRFNNLYKHSVNAFLNYEESNDPVNGFQRNPITITYAVGGAGAQKENGKKILQSLAGKIDKNLVKLNLIAGTRTELRDFFVRIKNEITGDNKNVQIIWAADNEAYFDLFNECMQTTDILWTKPSELSFYCALGIPIIMTPAIGPQEKCNRRWLRETGSGFKQRNPEYTDQWLFDLIHKGRLAESAWLGFLKARKYGTYNILDFLEKGTFVQSNDPLKR